VWTGELSILGELHSLPVDPPMVHDDERSVMGGKVNDEPGPQDGPERIQSDMAAGILMGAWGGESAYAASAPGDVPLSAGPTVEVDEPRPEDGPEQTAPLGMETATTAEGNSLASIICAYNWDCRTALRIVRCESNFRADAVGAGSWGLWQIQASVHAAKWPDFWQSWSDPLRNTEYAWEIYQSRGWAAWSCA